MTPTVNQASARPTRKVTYALIGSIVVAVASAIVTAAASVHIPPVVLEIATVIGAVVPAYLAKERAPSS